MITQLLTRLHDLPSAPQVRPLRTPTARGSTVTAASSRNEGKSPPQFSREELTRLESDDAAAGRRFATILATAFSYSATMMLIILWWTLHSVR